MRRVVVLVVAIVVVTFLTSYFITLLPSAQKQQNGVRLLNASFSLSSVKSGEPVVLTVRVANELNDSVYVDVLLSIGGEVEKYVEVAGFNIKKIREGTWLWNLGLMPPGSEIKHVAKLTFNIPSGIAEIKYRLRAEFIANGTTFDSKDLLIKVSG
ncbi:MAG: hypothetical protein N3F04_00990 [Candidatus Nezhaarchaeota archaeon]|nr:hypothetical protein [Candidatus Nezhaarchaeota archaeon]MCX8141352.1 hypothetical protein [Candidatus Nezhaarchaeota archaeon]MDW8049618.1 hypothetical protein [Nitrososphaerota archaeon]